MGYSWLESYPYIGAGMEGVIPPRELWEGKDDTLDHYLRWPYEYRVLLPVFCEMREDSSVLELACGAGRTMLGMRHYLKPPGRYEGLDISPKQIEFAQRNIHSRSPHFNFTQADIYNGLYNPKGRLKAESYQFPYPDECFDIVYAASLFTHLLPDESVNYFRESKRVLRKGGKCLFSFFVLDWYRGPGTSFCSGYQFDHPLQGFEGVAVFDPKLPEGLIAYRTSLIEKMASNNGLKVTRVIPGYWSRSHKWNVFEQDLVLLEAEW